METLLSAPSISSSPALGDSYVAGLRRLPMAGCARTRNSSISSSNLTPISRNLYREHVRCSTRRQLVPMSLDVDLIADPSFAVTEVVHGHDRRLALTDPATS